MEFLECLKELRIKANFTQVEVAEKLGISQPAYASWERGVKNQYKKILLRLYKYWML